MSRESATPPLSPVRGFVTDIVQLQIWGVDMPIIWKDAIKQSYTYLEYAEPPYPNCPVELKTGTYYYCYCKFNRIHNQKYLRARIRINEGWMLFQPTNITTYHGLICIEVTVFDRYLQQWL